jgi:serine/threonine protein kinase/tetratricopeptide (TPR) repeat protein
MSDLVGTSLGKYQLIERLGRGGMAEVYRAHQPGLERDVAIKVLYPHLADAENFIKRFKQEAVAVARLRHPHIVQVHDFDVEGNIYYMVMEFIAGPTLKAELEKRRIDNQNFSLPEITQLFSALASAVNYAHHQGMVHRDLKPANVMLNQEGQVILTDFGIAHILGAVHHTVTGAIAGTPAYMSPEQGQGEKVDHRSDIYSLGVILYELLTGQQPFGGDTSFAIILKHISIPPPSPSQINPNLPQAVEQVVIKALNKNPDDRFQTADDMAQALQLAVSTAAVSTPAVFSFITLPGEADLTSAPTEADLADQTLPTSQPASLGTLPEPNYPPEIPRFAGRKTELAYFTDKLAGAHLAVITGPPGVGKTALMATLARQTAAPAQTFWHTCQAETGVEAIIWQLAVFLAKQGQVELWQMWQSAQQIGGQLPSPYLLGHYLGHLLSGQGYLLCFDDFHLLEEDDQVAQFLARLNDLARAGQLSLLITSQGKPRFVSTANFEPLAGLSAADIQTFLTRRKLSLPNELVAQLHTLTGGNAQLLTLASYSLQRASDPVQWMAQVAEADDLERHLLLEVHHRLTEFEQEVMLAAAILPGDGAATGAIAAILANDQLEQTLSQLSQAHLLLAGSDKTNRSFIQSALVRAFYEELLGQDERRQEWYLRAAKFYEANKHLHLLNAACYYEQAGDYQRAADLATAAVPALLNQGQARPLGRLLARLTPAQLKPLQWAAVNLAQGELYRRLGKAQAAEENYQEVFSSLASLDSQVEAAEFKARACQGMGRLLKQAAPQEALSWLRRGVAELDQAQSSLQAEFSLEIGRILLALGDYAGALSVTRQGFDLLPSKVGPLHLAACENFGFIYEQQAEVKQAIEQWRQGLKISRQLRDWFKPVELWYHLGQGQMTSGDWADAVTALRESLALAERWGQITRQLSCHLSLGILYTRRADYTLARQHLTTMLELAGVYDPGDYKIRGQSALAELSLTQGAVETAASLAAEAEALAQVTSAAAQLPAICRLLGRLHLAQRQYKTAWDHARRAVTLARELGLPGEEGAGLAVLGQTLLANDQVEAAKAAFERSFTLLASQAPYEAACAQVEWGRYLFLNEEPEDGRRLLQAAQATLTRLGAQPELTEVSELLAT